MFLEKYQQKLNKRTEAHYPAHALLCNNFHYVNKSLIPVKSASGNSRREF